MAESVLQEILEKVVEISDKDNQCQIAEKVKEDQNEDKSDLSESQTVTEGQSESDINDDLLTDENNNELLTTEDEAEDFLRYCLRDIDSSDPDENKESDGFDNRGNDSKGMLDSLIAKSLNVASGIMDIVHNPLTTSGNLSSSDVGSKNEGLKLHGDEDLHGMNDSVDTAVKGIGNEVGKDTLGNGTNFSIGSSSLPILDDSSQKNGFVDNNNNACANTMLNDASLYKCDWSNYYSSISSDVTGNRDLCTPDPDAESISPELCCIMQLSPDAIYGKDHTVGCQRLYSRPLPHTARSESTLNTPDPILFGDTDSNGSDMPVGKFGSADSENPVPWSGTDLNNNVAPDDVSRGTKRKLEDVGKGVVPSPGVSSMSNDVVTNLMNQGRPPDISTWRAVSPTGDSISKCSSDDVTGHWNKPTCTVPPFQNTAQFRNDTSSGLYSANQPQEQYTARIYNPFESQSYAGVNHQTFPQYNMNNVVPGSSCQFTAGQPRNYANYGYQGYNNGVLSSASYRLDFSSPVNTGAPGMINFVSHPLHSRGNLTRPQAVYANSLSSMNCNNTYPSRPGYSNSYSGPRYANVPSRHFFNQGQFRTFQQPQSQTVPYSVPFQNTQMNYSNYTSQLPRIPPSATQTFAESQANNANGTYFENTQQAAEVWKTDSERKSVQMPQTTDGNNNQESTNRESTTIENDKTNAVGCEECDLIADPLDNVRADLKDNSDPVRRSADLRNDSETVEENIADDKDGTEKEDEAVRSNEADSTTIDLTVDSLDENKDDIVKESENVISPAPAHAYAKVQNKYFTEIYRQKCRSNSPITSFCTALDLSKRAEKKESKKIQRPTVPPKIRPYGEPGIPLSAVLNNMQAPALAYSGAMLVPYMNSIFAAMAHQNKTQTAVLNRSGVTSANTFNSTYQTHSVQSSPNKSPLTHSSSGNLTLNQQVLMGPNLLSIGNTSGALSENACNSQNVSLPSARSTSEGLATDASATAPRMNINGIPLPLFATPLQYPIRPLVPVINPVANLQRAQSMINPYLYRLNIGLPMQTTSNSQISAPPSTDNNNNTAVSTVRKDVWQTSFSNTDSGTTTKPTTRATKTKSESAQRKRKSSSSITGVGRAKQSKKESSSSITDNASSRSISAVDGLSMSIQGNSFTATKATQSKGLTTYQPIPDGKMNRSSDRKKKTFKAKHFPFTFLQIGSFEYTCGVHCSDKVARVKLLFSKRVMVYEFQLENPDGTSGACKDMAEIEVPFSNIVSIWLYDRDLRVEVRQTPKCCLGKRGLDKNMKNRCGNAAVYDRKLHMDVTHGQLCSSPYHYVQFKNCCADRVRAELQEFDKRFEMLFRLPLIEDPSKSLKQGTKQLTSQLLDPSICLPEEDVNNNYGPVYQPDLNREVSVSIHCSCTNGCSAGSCQCCVRGTTCSEGVCDCENCRNPLNILHQLGLPAERARTDPCLMENIYQIKRLDCYVKTQLLLECCHIPVLLFSCIPGEVRCVGPNCTARYKYSWCTARLLNEDKTPRNHCVKCGVCTDYRNEHCQKCKVCYFAGVNHTVSCPLCQKSGKGTLGNSSSTDSDA